MVTIATSLSLCIICKDEEKNILNCINSVSNICDEIIVVDTGSTDSTVNICTALGAKVLFYEWTDDFSAARNFSLENATKDWILFLDCDEEISPTDCIKLKSLIQSTTEYEGIYFRITNIINGKQVNDAVVLRAFKNKPEYRFTGKIHEQIVQSIENNCGIKSILESEMNILHYGYDSKVSSLEKKTNRNINILLSYDEKDKDGYYYYALGNEYAVVKNIYLAILNYKEALKKYKTSTNLVYLPYLAINLCKILYSEKNYIECLEYINEFKLTLGSFKDLYFIECLCYMAMFRITNAANSLEKYLTTNNSSYKYPVSNFKTSDDLNKLYTDLKSKCIPNSSNLLTVWIPLDEYNENISDCIKSVNNISTDVFVLTENINNIPVTDIRNSGGNIISLRSDVSTNILNLAMNSSVNDYILLLYPNEMLSYKSQIQLSNLLHGDNLSPGYIFNIFNTQSLSMSKRFALFKKQSKVFSLDNYEEHLINTGLNPILTNIIIHSVN